MRTATLHWMSFLLLLSLSASAADNLLLEERDLLFRIDPARLVAGRIQFAVKDLSESEWLKEPVAAGEYFDAEEFRDWNRELKVVASTAAFQVALPIEFFTRERIDRPSFLEAVVKDTKWQPLRGSSYRVRKSSFPAVIFDADFGFHLPRELNSSDPRRAWADLHSVRGARVERMTYQSLSNFDHFGHHGSSATGFIPLDAQNTIVVSLGVVHLKKSAIMTGRLASLGIVSPIGKAKDDARNNVKGLAQALRLMAAEAAGK